MKKKGLQGGHVKGRGTLPQERKGLDVHSRGHFKNNHTNPGLVGDRHYKNGKREVALQLLTGVTRTEEEILE